MAARVVVRGVQKVLRQFELLQRNKENLHNAFRLTGKHGERIAITLAPFETGALIKSIRSDYSQSRATLIAGGPSTRKHGGGVYAPISEYGTYTHRSKGPQWFLHRAMNRSVNAAERNIEKDLEGIIKRVGLGPT